MMMEITKIFRNFMDQLEVVRATKIQDTNIHQHTVFINNMFFRSLGRVKQPTIRASTHQLSVYILPMTEVPSVSATFN